MLLSFTFKKLDISEIILVEPKIFPDERGLFFENYKESEFLANEINSKFIQDNISHSTNGVLRGLHFQRNPKAQAKLVTVLTGKIFDVAVDIRKNSPTYGKWVSEILSEDNHHSLFIPEGFAHGFCVLSNEAFVLYKVNQEYSPKYDGGILWDDPTINIKWPINTPKISKKDGQLPLIKNIDANFEYSNL